MYYSEHQRQTFASNWEKMFQAHLSYHTRLFLTADSSYVMHTFLSVGNDDDDHVHTESEKNYTFSYSPQIIRNPKIYSISLQHTKCQHGISGSKHHFHSFSRSECGG